MFTCIGGSKWGARDSRPLLVQYLLFSAKNIVKQECIPVGCVLSAAVAVGGGGSAGGMSAQGVFAQGDVCPGGVYRGGGICLGVVSAQGVFARGSLLRGDVCPGVVSAQGDICPGARGCLPREVRSLPGGCLPQCMLGYTSLCEQNDRCL